jgi:WD40 repeat protein
MSKEYWIRPDDKTDWSPITALPELKPFFADTAAPGQKPTAVSPGRQDREVWRELRTLKGHTRQVNSVTYSPDGRRIVSGPAAGIFRDDGTIRICDAESGQILQTLEEHVGVIWFVAYSPDGRRIVSGPGSTIRIWDAENGRLLHTLETSGWGHPMAYSPDGRRIAFGSILYRTIKIWGVE